MKQHKESLPQVESAILWLIKSVAVNEFLSPEYKELLGPVPLLPYIPVEQSTQQPVHAMDIKVLSMDGNIEIVENLEH